MELTRAMLWVLLVLSARGSRHGYAIMQEIVDLSNQQSKVAPGTLYRAIAQMLEHQLIDDVPTTASGDERRKCYRITDRGREALRIELYRIETVVRLAREAGL
jgi:DNA-binding PadR family transcriptional regulator